VKSILLILALALCAFSAQPFDSVAVEKKWQAVRAAQTKPAPCYELMSLNDSAGKPYCYVCKSDTMRITIKRTVLSKAEIERIYKTTEWLDTLR
jgi:hypothetical protein